MNRFRFACPILRFNTLAAGENPFRLSAPDPGVNPFLALASVYGKEVPHTHVNARLGNVMRKCSRSGDVSIGVRKCENHHNNPISDRSRAGCEPDEGRLLDRNGCEIMPHPMLCRFTLRAAEVTELREIIR
ncbi:hypothetical protein ZHAS_00009382 [Anopheles sinensis]|uniref:Uncharacterized protein n=1 Tax=Anopheles sinensis TaxID=74873 RepID=A0A084VUV5_ANOSI|nr:hypothetical protein ZHAS_00009382 [Anopheles sinensis]